MTTVRGAGPMRRAVLVVAAVWVSACGQTEETVFTGRSGTKTVASRTFFLKQVTVGVRPYDAFAPYALVLNDCVYLGRREDSCTLLRLPPLGLSTPTTAPTVEEIMGRVLVSHEWMGRRFREVLESLPEDLRLLFRPIPAVVISTDVRPSFYSAFSGAIYIDPAYLWRTEEEYGTLSRLPDFRSGDDDGLSFAMPWRTVRGSRYAYLSRPRGATTRSFDSARLSTARLLYHELAHANDWLAPERLAALSPYQTFFSIAKGEVQRELKALLPLRSQVMTGLGAVAFWGSTASATQKAYSPDFVASEFAADRANDFYNYASPAEDVAMLFEELMMFVRFGVDYDVAVSPRVGVPTATGSDYLVVWGQRNRIGDRSVRERARLVARRLLPELPLGAAIDALPLPRQMVPGRTWTDNLALVASGRLDPLDAEARREADEFEVETLIDCATSRLHEAAGLSPPR